MRKLSLLLLALIVSFSMPTPSATAKVLLRALDDKRVSEKTLKDIDKTLDEIIKHLLVEFKKKQLNNMKMIRLIR